MRTLFAILAVTLLPTTAHGQDYGAGAAHVGGAGIVAPAAGGVVNATDWTASFDGVWRLDEASGTRFVDNDSICGSGTDCDLTDDNTVTQDTSNFREGSASATFTEANNERLRCGSTICDELDPTAGQDFSYGCWARTSLDESNILMLKKFISSGFELWRTASTDAVFCRVGDGSSLTIAIGATNEFPADDSFVHLACVFDNTANTLQPYVNAVASGSGATKNDIAAATSSNFTISYTTASIDWEGEADECFVAHKALTAAELCRICSCNIDGKLCVCDGTSYTDSGQNSSNCGSCTLPNCDAAAP